MFILLLEVKSNKWVQFLIYDVCKLLFVLDNVINMLVSRSLIRFFNFIDGRLTKFIYNGDIGGGGGSSSEDRFKSNWETIRGTCSDNTHSRVN